MTLSFLEIPIPDGLTAHIHTAIAKIEASHRRRMASIGIVAGLASFVGMIALFRTVLDSLHTSGFFLYVSILFSDGAKYWKEVGFAILDSLPIWGIAAFLAVTTAFIISAFEVRKNTANKKMRKLIKHSTPNTIVWN